VNLTFDLLISTAIVNYSTEKLGNMYTPMVFPPRVASAHGTGGQTDRHIAMRNAASWYEGRIETNE